MDIKARIKKLEQRPEAEKPRAIIVYVRDASAKAIAFYKAKHPEWEPSPKDIYIRVVSEDGKRNTERLLAGERT